MRCEWKITHRQFRGPSAYTSRCERPAAFRLTHIFTTDRVETFVCSRHVRRYTARIGAFDVMYFGGREKPPKIYEELKKLAEEWVASSVDRD